jgi:methyl-accepting chemotaxis protein
LTDVPLFLAQYDHSVWVSRIIDRIQQSLSGLFEDEMEDHTICRFGRWYEQDGKIKYGDFEGFHAIGKLHQEMHLVAEEALLSLNSGKWDLAMTYGERLAGLKDVLF